MFDFTIKKKMLGLLAGVVVFTLIQGFVLWNETTIVNKNINHYFQIESVAISKASDLKQSIIQVQQWLTDISATRGMDGLNDGFDQAEQYAVQFRLLIEELSQLHPELAAQYQILLPAFETYYLEGVNMAKAYVADGPSAGNSKMAGFDEAAETSSRRGSAP